MIEAEHASLVAARDGLVPDEWLLPSLGPDWRALDPVAHLIGRRDLPAPRLAALLAERG